MSVGILYLNIVNLQNFQRRNRQMCVEILSHKQNFKNTPVYLRIA